jgi:hypothetical protein
MDFKFDGEKSVVYFFVGFLVLSFVVMLIL